MINGQYRFSFNPKKPDGITPSGNQVTRQEIKLDHPQKL